MNRWEAVARREVVQTVAEPTPVMLLSTARTITLLRMSARNASYHALRTTSSRKASAAPAPPKHSPSLLLSLGATYWAKYTSFGYEDFMRRVLSGNMRLDTTGEQGVPLEMVGTMSVLLMMVVTYPEHERASSTVMQAGQAMAKHVASANSCSVSRSLYQITTASAA